MGMTKETGRMNELHQRLADLAAEVIRLQGRVGQLETEKATLQAENAALRRRLGLNSKNSHQPPASEGYKKKTVEPGLPAEPPKRRGGQAGHKGETLRPVEQADKQEIHLPEKCAVCGRAIGGDEAHRVVGKRQVFEVPEPKLVVTEHRRGEVVCCGQKQRGAYPAYLTGKVQYGPGVQALVTKLSVDHKMPLEQICRLFRDLYGYELNSETVERALEEGYTLSQPLAEAIKTELQQAPVVHVDETGIRVEGKLHWLHTASTPHYTHLFVHEKRGGKALNSPDAVLPHLRGHVIHDCLAAYFKFTQVQHGLCNAHLLRELNGLMEQASLWAKTMHTFLLDLYTQPRPLSPEAAATARQRYQHILTQAEAEEPPPQPPTGKGRPKNTPGRNLLRRLTQHQEAVLAFAVVAGVPFTNNQAERDLRPAKIKQKVSGCFRTTSGAKVYARLQALISTARKQERNVFTLLRSLFAHQSVSLYAG